MESRTDTLSRQGFLADSTNTNVVKREILQPEDGDDDQDTGLDEILKSCVTADLYGFLVVRKTRGVTDNDNSSTADHL